MDHDVPPEFTDTYTTDEPVLRQQEALAQAFKRGLRARLDHMVHEVKGKGWVVAEHNKETGNWHCYQPRLDPHNLNFDSILLYKEVPFTIIRYLDNLRSVAGLIYCRTEQQAHDYGAYLLGLSEDLSEDLPGELTRN